MITRKTKKIFYELAIGLAFILFFSPAGSSSNAFADTDNYALYFDNADLAIIPDSPSLNPNQITVETWVWLGAISTDANAQFFVCKGGDRTTGAYILGEGGGAEDNTFFFEIAPYWSGNILSTPVLPLEKFKWYHVAGTYDGNTMKIYVDDVLKGSKDIGSVQVGNSSPLYFSYDDVGGFPYYLKGRLNDVRIWNVVKTQSQIQAAMNQQLIGNEAGLVGYWPLDEGFGQSINDQTANNNHGQLGSTLSPDQDDPAWILKNAPVPGWLDDFESYDLDAFPSSGNWQLIYEGNGIEQQYVDNTYAVSGSQSLHLVGSYCWSSNVYRHADITSRIRLEASVYVDQIVSCGCTAGIAGVSLANPNLGSWGTVFGAVFFCCDGNVYAIQNANDRAKDVLLMSYNPANWYYVQLDVDFIARAFDVYIDGVLLGADLQIEDTGMPTGVLVQAGHGANPTVWFDDVGVTPSPEIEALRITPAKGGNAGRVTVKILGHDFASGTIAKLVRNGREIVGSNTNIFDPGKMATTFDLVGAAPGLWDLIVILPDSTQLARSNCFTVEEGGEAKLWVDVVGPISIRSGRDATFNLRYGNNGNVNARDILIWIAVPDNVILNMDVPYLQDIGPSPQDIPVIKDGYVYYWLVADKLGTNEAKGLNIKLNSTNFGQIQIRAGIIKVYDILNSLKSQQSSINKEQFAETSLSMRFNLSNTELRSGDIAFKLSDQSDPAPTGHVGIVYIDNNGTKWVIDFVTTGKGIGNGSLGGYPRKVPFSEWSPEPGTYMGTGRPEGLTDLQASDAAEYANTYYNNWVAAGSQTNIPYAIPPRSAPVGNWPVADDCISWLNDRFREAGYSPPWTDLSSPGGMYEYVTGGIWPEAIYRILHSSTDLFGLLDVFGLILNGCLSYSIQVVTSIDPNDKAGPVGFDPEDTPSLSLNKYITPDHSCGYMVFFENLETATAAAQEVLITDQLDSNLDWSSFSFSAMQIGEEIVSVPEDSQEFQTTVDLRPEFPALVYVNCSFNPSTGLVQCLFQGKNPETEELADFLPPNTEAVDPQGRGWVSYNVNPKIDLPTGTVITNKAIIDFEVDIPPAPMDTPEVFNTIDSGIPASSVSSLSATQNTSGFTVTWSGSDDSGGSGIKNYDIYVSDNDAPFSLWTTTSDTSAVFSGQDGHHYSFFSRARDNVGNIEEAPLAADTDTIIEVIYDLDSDGDVDIVDIMMVAARWNTFIGDPNYAATCDLDSDGDIDIIDIMKVAAQWGMEVNS